MKTKTKLIALFIPLKNIFVFRDDPRVNHVPIEVTISDHNCVIVGSCNSWFIDRIY